MPALTAKDSIVIIGAGIIGLDVGLVLAEKGFGQNITIVAEYLPGDTAPSYTSPWAGCNYSAISGSDAKALRWDQIGYGHLMRLASTCSEAAFVKKTRSVEVWSSEVSADKIAAMSTYLQDFAVLPADQLPDGARFGVSFTTVTVNAPQHLLWLSGRLQAAGVTFVRAKLPSLQAAFASAATHIVFHCTGNAARLFAGVQDEACYPTRGQVLLVRAPQVATNMMGYTDDTAAPPYAWVDPYAPSRTSTSGLTYVIPRPGTDGHVILGGYYQQHCGDHATYAHETASILARTRALSPEVAAGPVEVLGVVAGLRPSREGGARVERTPLFVPSLGQERVVVHNYGAGGTGFQAGYGMAVDAVASVEDLLGPSSKL